MLHGVSFALGEARLLGLLGRNGAGKTTCMNVAIGLSAAARAARVAVNGNDVTGRFARDDRGARRRAGAAGTPHLPQPDGARKPAGRGAPAGRRRRVAAWTFDRVYETFPRLSERQQQVAGFLSGGEQQMLAIGRALMSNPRVLLMDEPSEGLAPQIVAEVMATIRRLKQEGLSIVLVEQNAKLVFDIADDIVILNSGQVAVSGTTEDLSTPASICSSTSGFIRA